MAAAPPPDLRLHPVAAGTGEVDLNWTLPSGVQTGAVVILRDGHQLASVDSATTMYADLSVQSSTPYTYVVEARNAAGQPLVRSKPARVKTPEQPDQTDNTPPSQPHQFTVIATGSGNRLDWYASSDDTDVTAYRIYRDGTLIATVDGATLQYLDSAADPATAHLYEIAALDPLGHDSQRATGDVPPHGNGVTGAAVAQASEVAATPTATAAVAYASQLRRYPYLTDVVDKYATINWATNRSQTTGSARWGMVASDGSCTPTNSVTATKTSITVNSVGEYQWKAMLTLEPNRQYCYRVSLGSTDLLGGDPSPHFWTQIPAGSTEPFSFVVFGDWGYTDSEGTNPDLAALMQRVAASGARFALTVGDNAYSSGSQTNYGDLVETGPSISGVFGPSFWAVPGRSIPIFPATGNHGYASSNSPHPHLVNFPQDRATSLSNGRYARETYSGLDGTTTANYPSAWYAFDAGTARIYVLTAAWADSNVGTGNLYRDDSDYHWAASQAEYQWLENDLKTHPAQVKLAVLHFPLYSDNSSQSSDTYLNRAGSLEGLLGTYGATIAFSGHTHLYERNLPNADGLVTYVTGGGGAKVESVNNCSSFDAYAIGWSFSTNQGNSCHGPVPTSPQQVYHFLLVRVDGNQVTVTPTDETGRTFDIQTYTAGGDNGGGGAGGGGAATLTFTPAADTYAQQTTPDTNYGTASHLQSDESPARQESFLRFSVSGLTGPVASATLRLYVSNGSSNGPAVYATSNDWSETGLTWNNKPAATGAASVNLGKVTSGTWVELDVTPLVSGNGTFSFTLVPDGVDGTEFHSREAANKPQLVITTGG
ncbi:MAG TPA: DNRLRE domain-containing protein [Thermomicrobiaceae bacterium]|nr:DNRLRE domain-containing protein [Thermomicrobiaceae bacterium]